MSNQHQPIGNGAVFKLPPSSASALVTDDIDVAHLMDTMSGDFGSLTLAGVGDEISSLGQILGLGPVAAAAAAAATAATSAVGGSTTTTTTTTTTGTAVTVLDQGKATAGPGLALPQVIVPESDLMTIDVTELDLGHTEESMNDLEELIFKDSQGHNAVSTTMPPVNMVAGGRQMNAAATAAVSMIKQEPAATAAATAAAPVAAMTDGRRKRPHDPVQSELEWKNQLQMMQRMRQQELEDMGILPSVREGQPARPVLRIVNQPYPCQKKRYKTDGPKRGIIKSATGSEYPSIQIERYGGTADVVAYAATSTSDPHPFYDIDVAPDNYNAQMTSLSDGTPCVKLSIGHATGMKAIFSGVSTKRLKLREVKAKLGYDRWLQESEIVHLGFLAFIPTGDNPQIVLNGLSQSIDVYDALPELPILRKIIPPHGIRDGGFEMCLVGQHFSGAKVRFYDAADGTNCSWEEIAQQDPQDCTETHLVVKVPRCPSLINNPHATRVNVEVITGPVKIPRRSNTLHFFYS
ncbi:uncharacterized protein [Oscarella lobularis]|uniref:uncharacterized protein n=1 Tax=Oscarella lobularis TaxID=121494 RepID=UPI00331423E4